MECSCRRRWKFGHRSISNHCTVSRAYCAYHWINEPWRAGWNIKLYSNLNQIKSIDRCKLNCVVKRFRCIDWGKGCWDGLELADSWTLFRSLFWNEYPVFSSSFPCSGWIWRNTIKWRIFFPFLRPFWYSIFF